jgi:hypothetical protein
MPQAALLLVRTRRAGYSLAKDIWIWVADAASGPAPYAQPKQVMTNHKMLPQKLGRCIAVKP